MTIRITVAQHERALLWRNGRFVSVIEPGVRWLLAPFNRIEIELYDLRVPKFSHARIDKMLRQARATMHRHFHIVELAPQELGLVYKNGDLAGVLEPGSRQLYWKGPMAIRVERLAVSRDFELPATAPFLVREVREMLQRVAAAIRERIEELEALERLPPNLPPQAGEETGGAVADRSRFSPS